MSAPPRPARATRRARVLALPTGLLGAALVLAAASAGSAAAPAAPAAGVDGPEALYLVTMAGPGTAGSALPVPPALQAEVMLVGQDAALADVGSPEPVYRWTTALDGFAVRLDAERAAVLAARPDVALVEPSTVQHLARAPLATSAALPLAPGTGARHSGGGGGDGVVIGVVDSGVDPDSPVLAPLAASAPAGLLGACDGGEAWPGCTTKLVGAGWFVEGFGRDRVRTSTTLSARDDVGHGTLVASIAAGDAGLSVREGSARLGTFAGLAPEARVAAYKACWTAPDPADDGCATADLVAAIDRATADGVDVLTLAVDGPAALDTVERAALGATEAGVLVVGAAGNRPSGTAAHPSPWVLTVGAALTDARRARVTLSDGPTLSGAGSSTRVPPALRLVSGADAAVPGASRAAARSCTPGSLDSARVAGRAVLCVRGAGARVDKSRAVRQAGGRAVLLVNRRGRDVSADFHAVPTVHLDAAAGRALRRWAARHPRGEVTLQPSRLVDVPATAAPWSSAGGPAGVVKPDLLAPGAGVVGATTGGSWDLLSGTSAAAASVAGAAAVLMGRGGGSVEEVRSALVGGTDTAGVLSVDPRARAAVSVAPDVGAYRRWLADPTAGLDLATADLVDTATRLVTNPSDRTRTLTATTEGFASRVLLVAPAVLRLEPGASAEVTLIAQGSGTDAGTLVWTGDDGSTSRLPVRLR